MSGRKRREPDRELTKERMAELRIRLRDSEYMAVAIEGTAERILDELVPPDKEQVVQQIPRDGGHRGTDE